MNSTVTRPPKLHERTDEDVKDVITQHTPAFAQRMNRAAGDLIGDLEEIIEHELYRYAGCETLDEYARTYLGTSEQWCHDILKVYQREWGGFGDSLELARAVGVPFRDTTGRNRSIPHLLRAAGLTDEKGKPIGKGCELSEMRMVGASKRRCWDIKPTAKMLQEWIDTNGWR